MNTNSVRQGEPCRQVTNSSVFIINITAFIVNINVNQILHGTQTVQVTPEKNSSVFSHALADVSNGMLGAKLRSNNPSVLNWGCWLTQVVLYNGHKTV